MNDPMGNWKAAKGAVIRTCKRRFQKDAAYFAYRPAKEVRPAEKLLPHRTNRIFLTKTKRETALEGIDMSAGLTHSLKTYVTVVIVVESLPTEQWVFYHLLEAAASPPAK